MSEQIQTSDVLPQVLSMLRDGFGSFCDDEMRVIYGFVNKIVYQGLDHTPESMANTLGYKIGRARARRNEVDKDSLENPANQEL